MQQSLEEEQDQGEMILPQAAAEVLSGLRVYVCVCMFVWRGGSGGASCCQGETCGATAWCLQGATAAAAAQKGLIQADLSGWRWLSRWHSHEEAAAQWEHGVRAFIKIHTVDGKTLEFQTQWCGNVKPYSRQVFFIRKQGNLVAQV